MKTVVLIIAGLISATMLVRNAVAGEDPNAPIIDSQSIQIEKNEKKEDAVSMPKAVLIFEGMLAVNSAWAASNPQQYGYLTLVLFPLGGLMSGSNEGDRFSKPSFWVTLAGAEALAIYNIRTDEQKTTRSERFWANMKGWHGLILFSAATGYLAGDFDKDKNKKLSYAVIPEPQGGKLMLSYRF